MASLWSRTLEMPKGRDAISFGLHRDSLLLGLGAERDRRRSRFVVHGPLWASVLDREIQRPFRETFLPGPRGKSSGRRIVSRRKLRTRSESFFERTSEVVSSRRRILPAEEKPGA